MSDSKDFVAVVDSDARKTPRRIAFITKRTSPQVRVKDEDRVMTYPEVFFRTAVAIEVLAIALVITSLRCPTPGLAHPRPYGPPDLAGLGAHLWALDLFSGN